MKTKITQLSTACLAFVLAGNFLIAVTPAAMAQLADDAWSLPFIGLNTDHEGVASWDADGSGPEPYGYGHDVNLPGYTSYSYYSASRDYGDIDPDPEAAYGHLLGEIVGFPLFAEALQIHGYTPGQVKLKIGLCSLGDDLEGFDWFNIDNAYPHSFYYNALFMLTIGNEPVISGVIAFQDAYYFDSWEIETSFFKPGSAWSEDADPAIIAIGMAFLDDVGDEEIRLLTDLDRQGGFNGNGRSSGIFWDVEGIIQKGLPELPYMGLASEHQGMAGWNADGTGQEKAGDGHGPQRYYIGSRDYGDIDPDPNAAFGHFLPEMKGFRNLELQLAYRNYTIDQLVIKQGLSSLGNDVMGLDWGYENGTDYWCNYYDIDYLLELDGELIIKGLIDTSHSWMNTEPVYWWCDVTLDRPRDKSALSSENAQIIAAAFIKDMESRKLINDVQVMTYDTATFSGNGRYDGGFFNIVSARLLFKNLQTCCFVESDTLGGGMTDHTDWTLEHSPYFLDNNLVVPEGHMLIIEPGVKVAVRGPYSIDVLGSIQATGAEGDTIMFTHSNPLVNWNSIRIPGLDPEADSSLFSYCVFEHGYASSSVPIGYNSGGAVKIRFFDKVRFSHCIFRDNMVNLPGTLSPSGGAIALWTASPLIEYCSFYDNTASYGGAMICYAEANPIIKYSLFHGNRALVDGGAIIVYNGSAPTLLNSTITENTAFDNGGGVDLYNCIGDSVIFINNIIWNNTSVYTGQQISLTSPNNVASFKYNDIEGGLEGIGPGNQTHIYYSPGNIDFDPEFCGEGYIQPYNISTTSPCFQTGYGGENIGAFDTGCISTNIKESRRYADKFRFYPNPAYSGNLTIVFNLEDSGPIRLEIYNLTGEKVAEPVNDHLNAGEHRMAISTGELPSGIYIGRLTSGSKAMTCKLIIMR